VEEASPGTISGNMIENNAPAWAQWIALQTCLGGSKPSHLNGLATEVLDPDMAGEARLLREAFENGRPIPVASVVSVERFAEVVPILGYDPSAGAYAVGRGEGRKTFHAKGHVEAMARAARWFDKVRGEEIEAQQKRAKEATQKLPPLYVDLAMLQLNGEVRLTPGRIPDNKMPGRRDELGSLASRGDENGLQAKLLEQFGLALEHDGRDLVELLDPGLQFFDGGIAGLGGLGGRAFGGLVRFVRVGKGGLFGNCRDAPHMWGHEMR
jgi:hypothetical protein